MKLAFCEAGICDLAQFYLLEMAMTFPANHWLAFNNLLTWCQITTTGKFSIAMNLASPFCQRTGTCGEVCECHRTRRRHCYNITDFSQFWDWLSIETSIWKPKYIFFGSIALIMVCPLTNRIFPSVFTAKSCRVRRIKAAMFSVLRPWTPRSFQTRVEAPRPGSRLFGDLTPILQRWSCW